MHVTVEKDGKPETLEADYVLVSVGRRPSLNGIDAAALGLKIGTRGEILADGQMRTTLPNVFAIGDASAASCSPTRRRTRASSRPR